MLAAVISPDHKILAVIMADAAVDKVTPDHGYPEGSYLVEAPRGTSGDWTYHPVEGFKAPPAPPVKPFDPNFKPENQVEF